MAGDWIKMRHDLFDDPSVVRIARIVSLDRDTVVGKLYRLWAWADRHTTDGKVCDVGPDFVDDLLACPGFADAMKACGWLEVTGECFAFPKFDRHNGKSAKRRAMNQKWMQSARTGDESCGDAITTTAPPEAAPPEKSREEKKREIQNTSCFVATTETPKRRRSRPKSPIQWTEDSGFEGITDADRNEWRAAYPAVDIPSALMRAHLWLKANPPKAKKKNWARFVTNWLTTDQERGGGRPSNRPAYGEQPSRPPSTSSRSWRDDALANMTDDQYLAWKRKMGRDSTVTGLAASLRARSPENGKSPAERETPF